MPTKTKSYRSYLHSKLNNPIVAANYLNAALEDSAEAFLRALRNVSEAHRMAKVAEDAGLSREAMYRTLSDEGNPRLRSLEGILKAVGLKVKVEAEESKPKFFRHTTPDGFVVESMAAVRRSTKKARTLTH